MKELFMKFWTVESYATRLIRIAGIGLGTAMVAGQFNGLQEVWPVLTPTMLKAAGAGINIISAALTGGADGTKSGIPKKEN